ncbi:hypothetical protein G9A89_022258 [Geosiphon pyriformis]|nr:hypothetical protein G9A89_022258 [Geosiphon pyriformis]
MAAQSPQQNKISPFLSFLTIESKLQYESAYAFETHFTSIAKLLLKSTRLNVKNEKYALIEIEFYLKDQINQHSDPFTHGHREQSSCNNFYFHRIGSTGYKGGSRKGLDITFGDSSKQIYGGILIRAIQNMDTREIIEGPSLIVDKILELCQVDQKSGIRKLVEDVWKGKTGAFKEMENSNGLVYLEEIKTPLVINETKVPEERLKKRIKLDDHGETSSNLEIKGFNIESHEIFTSPRVGLTLSNSLPSVESRLTFLLKPYRYFTCPHILKKGKVQIGIGLYDHFKDIQKVAQISGIKESLISKYVSEIDNGFKFGKIDEFVGQKGKGVNLLDYCRMVGAVRQCVFEIKAIRDNEKAALTK